MFDVFRRSVTPLSVRVDISGKVPDAEITSKLNVSDCTTSEATLDLEEGTSVSVLC